ncbi:Myb-like_DNA-binding domain-containing protein [Hexamita inflata]|uniref:Myb-like DNA-binding domain-containing protein n=1 Tax=Hexamita inflata TaxID=28002 RepID=A0AA86TG32_9EUKA|nr:Myb-like DNA-binding domain-containing protein [Hexamita inflata]
MKPIKWTQSDCQNLLIAVENCKSNKRVDWSKVATFFPGRTAVQCKSQYTARLHLNSNDEKINMVWDISLNLLLSANALKFNMDWKQISEQVFQNKVSVEALKKQYMMKTVKINQNLKLCAERIIRYQCQLDTYTFTVYIFALVIRYWLDQYKNMNERKHEGVELPHIFQLLPQTCLCLQTRLPNQIIFESYFKILQQLLRIDEVITIMSQLTLNAKKDQIFALCSEFDENRKNTHRQFL